MDFKLIMENWRSFKKINEQAEDFIPASIVFGPPNGTGPRGKKGKEEGDMIYKPYGMLVNGEKMPEDPRWVLGRNDEVKGEPRHWGSNELIETITAGVDRVHSKNNDWYSKALTLYMFGEVTGSIESKQAKEFFARMTKSQSKKEYEMLKDTGLLDGVTEPLYIEDMSPGPKKEIDGYKYHPIGKTSGHGSHQNGQDADLALFMMPGKAMTKLTTFFNARERKDPFFNIDLYKFKKKDAERAKYAYFSQEYQKKFSQLAPHIGQLTCDPLNQCPPGMVCVNNVCMPAKGLEDSDEFIELAIEYQRISDQISNQDSRLKDRTSGEESRTLNKSNLEAKRDKIINQMQRMAKAHPEADVDKAVAAQRSQDLKGMQNTLYKSLGDFDPIRSWQLISGMLDTGYVTNIGLDASLWPSLKVAATICGEESKWSTVKAKLGDWAGHKNHIHVRVNAVHSKKRAAEFANSDVGKKSAILRRWRKLKKKTEVALKMYKRSRKT